MALSAAVGCVSGIYGIGGGSILAPIGAYCGARVQSRLPDQLIRRVTGIMVLAIGIRYLWLGAS